MSTTLFLVIGIIAIILIALVLGILFAVRKRLRVKVEENPEYKDTVFLIRMPKESAKVEEEKEKGGGSVQEVIREKISLAQTLYSNLSGLKAPGFFTDLKIIFPQKL